MEVVSEVLSVEAVVSSEPLVLVSVVSVVSAVSEGCVGFVANGGGYTDC